MAESDIGRSAHSEPEETLNPAPAIRLVEVPQERDIRAALKERVVSREDGVAECKSRDGVVTTLLVVTLDDDGNATQVPLSATEDHDINAYLDPNKISRIGMFLGCNRDIVTGAAIRTGLYPGVPLIQGKDAGKDPYEIMLGLRGLKPDEELEQDVARQIDLFGRFGFTPSHSRGLFDRFVRVGETEWTKQPLAIAPRAYDDVLEHEDRQRVEGSALQVLFYGANPVPLSNTQGQFRGSLGAGAFDSGFGMRSVYAAKVTMTREIGLSYGSRRSATGSVFRSGVDRLDGAMQVHFLADPAVA